MGQGQSKQKRRLWPAAAVCALLCLLACSEQASSDGAGALAEAAAGGMSGAEGSPAGNAGVTPPTAGVLATAPTGGGGAGSDAAGPDAAAPDAAETGEQQDGATAPTEDGGLLLDASASDGALIGDDRCDEAVLDPARPPRALALSGNLVTHDPTLIEHEGVIHLFQTGPRILGKTSTDLQAWRGTPSALGARNPAWISQRVPGATDLWAPDIADFGGRFHLYYSASTFGSNLSCIGHATANSLRDGAFIDEGPVICSARTDNYNAIDPNVIVDTDGTPWLSFGSFWSGIKLIRLDERGARAGDELHALASRGGGAIEAPVIVRRCGYYYLFVSFDRCCAGVDSTYSIRVGRSRAVTGPYLDRDGVPMMDGGGSVLVRGNDRFVGPGHNAVLFRGGLAYNVFHAYDATRNGEPVLRVAELAWDADGWPVSGGP